MASEGGSPHRSESGKRKGKEIMHEPPPPPPPPLATIPEEELFTLHFEKMPDPTTEDYKVICNHCGDGFPYKAGEGYGTFMNHLKLKHPGEIDDDTSSQGSTGTAPDHEFRYSYSKAKKEMARFICVNSLRFDTGDSDQFEEFLQHLNPDAKRFPRDEIIFEIKKLVKETRSALIDDFANLSNKVSICADIWSDQWKRFDFLAVTCHWVDDTWTLQKRLLAFKTFEDDHSKSANISHEIHGILQQYGLVTKVLSISFDYATANMANFESLIGACQPSIGAKIFHVRCISPILTLFVEKGLDTLKEEVAPIRTAAFCIFNRDSVTKKWGKYCRKNGLHPKLFQRDFPGRWDLTWKLLDETYQYRDALCSFFSEQQIDDIHLLPSQWDACSNLCRLLEVFKDVVEVLAGVYYPTSVLVVDKCIKVAVLLNSLTECDGLGGCFGEMMAKWLEYFHDIPIIFLVAKLLDPRVRIDGLEKLLGIYYDALFPVKDENAPVPSVVVAKAKTFLYDLFDEYKIKCSDDLGVGSSTSGDGSIDHSLSHRLQNLFDEIKGKRPKRYGPSPYQELETYFTADFEYADVEFDVLKWWSRRTMSFPTLSLIAKDILAVPASTVSVDQAFSTEGYALDERQSMLYTWNMENQRLLSDWTRAERRIQENNYDEAEDSDTISVGSDDTMSEDGDNPFDRLSRA